MWPFRLLSPTGFGIVAGRPPRESPFSLFNHPMASFGEASYGRWYIRRIFLKGEQSSFPGSAWERAAREALTPVKNRSEAEPRKQCIPRRSLGTRGIPVQWKVYADS